MKKAGLYCLTLCMLISLLTPSAFATAVEAPEQDEGVVSQGSTSYSIDSAESLLGEKQLIDNAEAVFLYEVNSGTQMYAWQADEQVYPSSLVKIMTALIAAEKGNLSDVITVKDAVISTVPYNAVSAELQPDEQITLESLLYCMLVGSANDAAAVIADYISGSQEAFVQEMNNYAKQLGCTGTNFINPHGLHHEEQVTTARDIARILSAAVKNETFYKFFTTTHCAIPATNKSDIRDLSTGNFLINKDSMDIYFDERVTGGRTGVSEDGRRCLAACAEGNGLKLISIVIGAEDVLADDGYAVTIYGGYKETSTLFDNGLDGYKAVQVLYPNQTVDQCSVVDGENHVVLGSKTAVSAVLPSNANLDDLVFRYTNTDEIRAPVTAGDIISKVEVWYGSSCVANADLYAMNSVKAVSDVELPEESADEDSAVKTVFMVIGIAVGVVVLFVVVLRVIPGIRRIVKRRHLKRYQRNRRRSR